ncbi:MAG: helix-turn-helix domain-containing protein [Leptolyngbya sp. BL-A-14]
MKQCRTDLAKQLLLRHDLRTRKVAAQVGSTNPIQFSKLFRQLTGVSPKVFRQH